MLRTCDAASAPSYSLDATLPVRMARFLARDSERRSRCSLRRCGRQWQGQARQRWQWQGVSSIGADQVVSAMAESGVVVVLLLLLLLCNLCP